MGDGKRDKRTIESPHIGIEFKGKLPRHFWERRFEAWLGFGHFLILCFSLCVFDLPKNWCFLDFSFLPLTQTTNITLPTHFWVLPRPNYSPRMGPPTLRLLPFLGGFALLLSLISLPLLSGVLCDGKVNHQVFCKLNKSSQNPTFLLIYFSF